MTTKQRVYEVLRHKRCYVPSYDLFKVNTEWGWIGSSGDRRARDLRAEGLIESKPCKEIKGMQAERNVVCFRIKRK